MIILYFFRHLFSLSKANLVLLKSIKKTYLYIYVAIFSITFIVFPLILTIGKQQNLNTLASFILQPDIRNHGIKICIFVIMYFIVLFVGLIFFFRHLKKQNFFQFLILNRGFFSIIGEIITYILSILLFFIIIYFLYLFFSLFFSAIITVNISKFVCFAVILISSIFFLFVIVRCINHNNGNMHCDIRIMKIPLSLLPALLLLFCIIASITLMFTKITALIFFYLVIISFITIINALCLSLIGIIRYISLNLLLVFLFILMVLSLGDIHYDIITINNQLKFAINVVNMWRNLAIILLIKIIIELRYIKHALLK